jgi:NAD(P)H-flavin reductase
VQLFEIIAVVAIVLALAAGTGLALVYRRLQRYQRNQHVIMGSRGTVDIVEHVAAVDDKLTCLA